MGYLGELYRYTKGEQKGAKECFTTAALTRLLSVDQDIRDWFWKAAFQKSPDALVRINHQVVWIGDKNGKKADKETLRPDIVLFEGENQEEPDRILVIEAKVDAGLGDQQPQKYYARALKRYPNKVVEVILLTRDIVPGTLLENPLHPEKRAFLNLTWDQLHREFHTELPSDDTAVEVKVFLRNEFCELMKEWNMIADPPLPANLNETVLTYHRFNSQMMTLARKIIQILDPEDAEEYTFKEKSFWYAGGNYTDDDKLAFSIYVFYGIRPEPERRDLPEEGNVFVCVYDYSGNEEFKKFSHPGFYKWIYWEGFGWAIRLRDIAEKYPGFYNLQHIDLQAKIIAQELEPAFQFLVNH